MTFSRDHWLPVSGYDLNKNGVDDSEDYAVFNLKPVGPGFINLPMTSFGYFSAGNAAWDDPDLQDHDGTLQWYNLLRGYITNTDVDDPTPFIAPSTGVATKFPLDGDPVTKLGDVDGIAGNFAPADRRMALSSGPFEMAPGDSQEVVVAIIGGESGSLAEGSPTQSVFQMKVNDEIAQFLYSTLFTQVPKPPIAPVVKATPLENSVGLVWGTDPETIAATEEPVPAGYHFEGYSVYQLPSPTAKLSEGVLIANFDVVNNVRTIQEVRFLGNYGQGVLIPTHFGNDTGLQRFFNVTEDALTGGKLFPGNYYYFAVTAYNYNEFSDVVKSLESSPTIIPVQTQSPLPGYKTGKDLDDMVDITHATGAAEQGEVHVKVIDPTQLTGHDYEVYFEP
jgi:hypothetical protein